MPLAKIHVVEGRYDEGRIAKVSGAIQAALMNTLRVPPEDLYQLIFEFPKKRFLHTPSFVGMHYTDDLIIAAADPHMLANRRAEREQNRNQFRSDDADTRLRIHLAVGHRAGREFFGNFGSGAGL